MGTTRRLDTVRASYAAYAADDLAAATALVTDDFTFSAPPDVGIDRATWQERCWPNTTTSRFDLVRLVEAGDDEVLVTYEATRADGTRFRNTEIHTFAGDLIRAVEVYFGWDLR